MPRAYKRGDQYVWGEGRRYPLFGEVIKLALDESWVDLRFYTWMFTWTHRLYRPEYAILDSRYRRDWTQEEVHASKPAPYLVLE